MAAVSSTNTELSHTMGRIEQKLDGIVERMAKSEAAQEAAAANTSRLSEDMAVLKAANLHTRVVALESRMQYYMGALVAFTFLWGFIGNSVKDLLLK